MTPPPPGHGTPSHDPYGEDPYGRRAYGETYGDDGYGGGPAYETYEGHGSYAASDGHAASGQAAWDHDPYAYPYERPAGGYQDAVDALSDPLTDPLPSDRAESGPRVPSWAPQALQAPQDGTQAPQGAQDFQGGQDSAGGHTSPWFRPVQEQGRTAPAPPAAQQAPGQVPHQAPAHPHGRQSQQPQQQGGPATGPGPGRGPADVAATAAMPALEPHPSAQPPGGRRRRPEAGPPTSIDTDTGDDSAAGVAQAGDERRTVALRRPSDEELGGRAARRRAAAGKGRGGSRGGAAPAAAAPRAMTRLEARRAARAAKDGPVVLLSRAIGEIFITCGVLMLLFVAYQLWWTNFLADNYAGGAKESLAQKWEQNPERKPGEFSPGQGFAIMYIPKLDVVVPVAEGIDKQSVLDNGLVGHYDEKSGVPTAMPWDEKGNFGVAGHRNTHGEPFRYINRLVAGDKIIVETADTYYVYEMYSRLPSTSPSNVSVLEPVPPQSGFEKPGRYITLTTCTPEFTSRYRLIVWGRMVDERPRSEGKPDALVG